MKYRITVSSHGTKSRYDERDATIEEMLERLKAVISKMPAVARNAVQRITIIQQGDEGRRSE